MPKPRSRWPSAARLAGTGALAAVLATGCSRVDAPARAHARAAAAPAPALALAPAADPFAGEAGRWAPAPVLAMADRMALRVDPAAGVLLSGAAQARPLGAEAWGALAEAAAVLQHESETLAEPGWALDRPAWLRAAAELREGSRDGERAARLRDPPRLAAAGERLRQACLDCHERYAPGPR